MGRGPTKLRGVGPAAVCIGFALVGAAFAVASPAEADTHLAATFHLKGTNGYEIRVAAHRAGLPLDMRKAQHHVGEVTVRADKTSQSAASLEGASASYTVPASFNRHRLSANLGPFGRVQLRFHKHPRDILPPSAPDKRRIGVCEGGGFYVPGKFRGTFRFRGEDGYTSAHIHRVHGKLRRDGPVVCHGQDRGTELKARSGRTRFLAFQDLDFGATALAASTRDRLGRVDIAREAHRITSIASGKFNCTAALTSAHAAPGGAFFTGSADYASRGSWTGTLAVALPGGGQVPLAGPDFSATLRRTEGSEAARYIR